MYKQACKLQGQGYSDAVIVDMCRSINKYQFDPPLDLDELDKIIESALKHDKGTQLQALANELDLIMVPTKDGGQKIRQCAENVARVILGDPLVAGKIKDDKFGHKLIYLGQLDWRKEGDTMGEWSDMDDSALINYLDMRYNLRNDKDYTNGFNIALLENSYDPLVGYLDALEWDGKPRIDTLLTDYLGADPSEYNTAVMRVFLLGAVRRAYEPGCKCDYMPVLIGNQGEGKSTFFKYLACNEAWYDDNFNFKNLDNKAVIEAMSGKWILEMGEMDTLKKDAVTADALKAFITSQSDRYRTPFARRPEDRKRQCVFCGTSNDANFLKDRTGNRRYLPVDTHKDRATKDIFDEKTARPEFIQAVAEAVRYYKMNPNKTPVLPKNVEADAMKAQTDHLEEDPWVQLIDEYLHETARDRVNVLCIWDEGFKQDVVLQKRADVNRILTIMRNDITGWHEVGKKRIDGYGRGAICFERDTEELQTVTPSVTKGTGFEAVGDTELIPF
jgi:predicted P-loop ATPase